MRDKGRDFADVLAEAQQLGYAEADPTFDVEGIDAAHKLAILGSLAFGIPLQFDKVYTEGISHITREDVNYAEQLGYRIKHLGITRRTATGVELRVHPTLIPDRRLIANVDGVMNAVLVHADIIDVARTLTVDPENRVPHLAFQPDALSDVPILAMEEVETGCYLRLCAKDKPGVMADIARKLGDAGISIEAIIQKEPQEGQEAVPVILLTRAVRERQMNTAIGQIEALDTIEGRVTRIRMEHLSSR
jgi:homoserine dehydrogenase